MTHIEAIELMLQRALRGETPPSVRAITGRLEREVLQISVFTSDPEFDRDLFSETVMSELDQVLPVDLSEPPACMFTFHDARAYVRTAADILFVDNPW